MIRIDGELGAAWTISLGNHSDEPLQAIVARQGKAIAALVRHGLGPQEDFARLHATLCGLRPPDYHRGLRPDCGDTDPLLAVRAHPDR